MEFNVKLKKFFRERNIKNKEIAVATGYSEMMVSRYLKDAKPNYEFMMAINRVYSEIDWNHLLKSENTMNFTNEEEEPYKVDPMTLLNRMEYDIKQLKKSFGTISPQE